MIWSNKYTASWWLLKETVSFYSHIKLILESAVKAHSYSLPFPAGCSRFIRLWKIPPRIRLCHGQNCMDQLHCRRQMGPQQQLGIPRIIKDQTNPSVVLYQPLLLPVRVRTQIQGGQWLLSQGRAKRSCTGTMLSLLLKSSILISFNESWQLSCWGLVNLPSPCACSNIAAPGTTCLVKPELCLSHVCPSALGWQRGKEPEVRRSQPPFLSQSLGSAWGLFLCQGDNSLITPHFYPFILSLFKLGFYRPAVVLKVILHLSVSFYFWGNGGIWLTSEFNYALNRRS